MRRKRSPGNRAVRLLAVVLAAFLSVSAPAAVLGAEETGQEAVQEPAGQSQGAEEKQNEQPAVTTEGVSETKTEEPEVTTENVTEGTTEAAPAVTTEGQSEGTTESAPQITTEGESEGTTEGQSEVTTEGPSEIITEGGSEGTTEETPGEEVSEATTEVTDASMTASAQEEAYAGDWVKSGKKWRFLLPDGAYARNRFVTVDGEIYYLDAKGYMKTGWITVGKRKYYARGSGAIQRGWKDFRVTEKINGKNQKVTRYYYFGPATGVMNTGWRTIGGKYYYFTSDGKNQKSTGWKKISGKWYYMQKDDDGHICAAVGWKQVKDSKKVLRWYYLEPSKELHGRMKTGWFTEEGKTYYFNSSGASVKAVQTINKKKYLFINEDGRGVLATGSGPTVIDGRTYYFGSGNALRTGWITENGKTYYYWSHMATGWKKISGSWYYFNGDGERQTGWLTLSGKTYYLQPGKNGAMVTGWKTIGGARYYFKGGGAMAVNTVVDGMKLGADGKMTGPAPDAMDRKAQGYSSSTRYLILVNRSTHKVSVYQGSKGKWTRVKRWSCGDGARATPTPEGTFKVGIKLKYFDTAANNRCWYATQFWGDYLFHSILYVKSGSPSKVRGSTSSQLGRAVSHGCVRLTLDNAKWIYNNIPSGTKVVVYH